MEDVKLQKQRRRVHQKRCNRVRLVAVAQVTSKFSTQNRSAPYHTMFLRSQNPISLFNDVKCIRMKLNLPSTNQFSLLFRCFKRFFEQSSVPHFQLKGPMEEVAKCHFLYFSIDRENRRCQSLHLSISPKLFDIFKFCLNRNVYINALNMTASKSQFGPKCHLGTSSTGLFNNSISRKLQQFNFE